MEKKNQIVVIKKDCPSQICSPQDSGIPRVLSCCDKNNVILDLIQDLPRLFSTRGFTLIELLVVVLIMGILAAVAVPQYKKAVIKSRLATIKPIIYAIKNAEEIYYLSNGTYTDEVSSLDINLPSDCRSIQSGASFFACDEHFGIDLIRGYDLSNKGTRLIEVNYCPNQAISSLSCKSSLEMMFVLWLDHSIGKGKLECQSTSKISKESCEHLI